MPPKATTVRCSSCGQPNQVQVHTLIDISTQPQLKPMLLSGQLNATTCAFCGAPNNLMAPVLYHDASKELLIAYVPMELNLTKDQQERAVGDLMNELPKNNFKGYMFNPKRALTLQGLIDQIMQADGVTPEMMAEQRARIDLVQQMIETQDDAALDKLITENDAQIDMRFFQTVTAMIQRLLQGGRQDLAERALYVQTRMTQLTSYGAELVAQQAEQEAVVEEVAAGLQGLTSSATRLDLVHHLLQYHDKDAHLQAIVGLIRPALDYEFFEELAAFIAKAPAGDRPALEAMRDKLLDYTRVIDQQTQARAQVAVSLLQAMVNAGDDLDALIEENLDMIDDTFMSVLVANLEEMQRRKNIEAMTRLKNIYERVVALVQSRMEPELLLVNRLLNAQSDEEVAELLQEAQGFGESIIDVMAAAEQMLVTQGQNAAAQRLGQLRAEVAGTFGK
jgi:hypothetical protein